MVETEQARLGSDRERVAVAFALLLFAGLAVAYSIVTPIFEGPDENWHYAYVEHIASGQGLPRQPPDQYPHLARQEASQPPLYYLLASTLIWWVPSDDLVAHLRENPHFAPVPWGYRDNQNVIVHTDAERYPYRGTALAVHLARLLSVLLGVGTVYCTYALARLLFPHEPWLAFGAMIVTALTPGFLFSSALVSNDTLVVFLSSLVLVLLVRGCIGRFSPAGLVVLGISLGCAALSKLNGSLLWLLAGLTWLGMAWWKREWTILVKVALPVFLLASVVAGWWYVRNWTLYGDPTGLNVMLDIVGRREPGFGLRDVLAEFEGIRWSYWALFGWFNVTVPGWLYRAYDALGVAALVGLGIAVVRAVSSRSRDELRVIVFLLSWLVLSTVGLIRWTLTTPGSQGRLLYPAIGAVSILLVRGWWEIVPRQTKVKRWLVVGVGVAFLAVAVYVPLFVIPPVYAQPRALTLQDVKEQVGQEPAIRFEEGIELLGYKVDRQMVYPGDVTWVTACWRGDVELQEDLIVFVQLLVEGDLIAAQKDTYHGLGSFPTSQWPAGVQFCDRYPLRVVDTVPAPSQGVISMGLYRSTGKRLQAFTEAGYPIGDTFRFSGPLVALAGGTRTLDYEWGHQIALVDYRLDRVTIVPGGNVNLSLFFRSLRQVSSDYVVTIQILDEDNTKIGQSDAPLATSTWQPGATVEERRTVEISADAAIGVYDIKVGLYEPETVENLTLFRDRQVLPGGGLLTLWKLRVLAPSL